MVKPELRKGNTQNINVTVCIGSNALGEEEKQLEETSGRKVAERLGGGRELWDQVWVNSRSSARPSQQPQVLCKCLSFILGQVPRLQPDA